MSWFCPSKRNSTVQYSMITSLPHRVIVRSRQHSNPPPIPIKLIILYQRSRRLNKRETCIEVVIRLIPCETLPEKSSSKWHRNGFINTFTSNKRIGPSGHRGKTISCSSDYKGGKSEALESVLRASNSLLKNIRWNSVKVSNIWEACNSGGILIILHTIII